MISKSDIFEALANWRPKATLDWVSSSALAVGNYTDGAGIYHPEFVLNFRFVESQGNDFTDLHFGTKFFCSATPTLVWVNEQNARLRFVKLALERDGIILSADLYGPDDVLNRTTFEGTYVLFDQALVLIRAMFN